MPRLREVAEKTQESASLGVLDGADVVYAARVPVRRIMSMNVSAGTRVPAYGTSMGRAPLAWAPADVVERVVTESTFQKLEPETIGTAAELERELAKVREQRGSPRPPRLETGRLTRVWSGRDTRACAITSRWPTSASPRALKNSHAAWSRDVEAASPRWGWTCHGSRPPGSGANFSRGSAPPSAPIC